MPTSRWSLTSKQGQLLAFEYLLLMMSCQPDLDEESKEVRLKRLWGSWWWWWWPYNCCCDELLLLLLAL